MSEDSRSRAVYVISVAAELAGVHPQTLRIYERKGLLDPSRTGGGSRRFSEQDLERLRHIQEPDHDRAQPRGRAPGARARVRGGPPARSRRPPAPQAREAVAATHRQYRRDLVPLRQSPVPYPHRSR